MEQFTDYLIAKGYSNQTAKSIVNRAMQFTAWMQAQHLEETNIGYNDITAYIKTTQQRSIKTRTVQVIATNLKHYLDYLVDAGIISQNPALALNLKNVKRKVVYNILSPAELDTLYKMYQTEKETKENAPPQTLNILARKRNKILIGLIVYQGAAAEDLNNIQLTHVDMKEGKITIPGTRRSNERTLKLEPVQIFELYEYINESRKHILQLTRRQSNKLLVNTGQGNQIQNSLFKLFNVLRSQNSQVQNLDQVRASVITNWLKQYNKRKAQYMAGHRYISSTERYEASNIEALQDDIEKYYPINS
jgi:integrase/recombinase XerD